MRRWIPFVVGLLLASFSALPAPTIVSAAWQHACEYPFPYTPDAGGIVESHLWLTAARAKVEDTLSTLPVLCVTSAGQKSYSKSFVEIGYNANNLDIYRVGTTACQYDGCPTVNNPLRDSGYFFAYGRAAGYVCGAEVNPYLNETLSSKSWAAGSFWYQITQSGNTYYAKVAGSTVNSHPLNDLNLCWGQVDVALYLSEHLDAYDQYSGRVADKQFWSSATWTDSSFVVHSVSRPYSAACDSVGLNGDRCSVASNLHDAWYHWDIRQP